MTIKNDESVRLNIQLNGESADRFSRIKRFLNLENYTEVIRSIINWYYREYEKDLSGPPKSMWHLNLDNQGVLIWDPDLHKAVHIIFSPKGIECEYDETDDCRHVQFALSQSEIQDVIRQRRKEGWNLPNV
jgi:hypothetical protein